MRKGDPGSLAEGSRKIIDKAFKRQGAGKENVERDAEGQFVQSRQGAGNDGMSSANPRTLSGKESGDATFPIRKGEKRK